MNIFDRLRKGPGMPCKVQRVVLSFSIHVCDRLLGDKRAALSCAPAVNVSILDPNSDRVPVTERRGLFAGAHFPGYDRSIADVHLHSMGSDADPHAKPKCIR